MPCPGIRGCSWKPGERMEGGNVSGRFWPDGLHPKSLLATHPGCPNNLTLCSYGAMSIRRRARPCGDEKPCFGEGHQPAAAIFLVASTRPRTAATDLSNIAFSSAF